jgi:trimeric autotransporter adhesin
MTKGIFAGASMLALLTATPALAQNSQSEIIQSGSSAVATVTQSGANDKSKIEQQGGGTVTVTQTGNKGSTSDVKTSADDRPPESTVTVVQKDDGSSSAATSQANKSTVIQDNVNGFGASGTGSTVSVTQTHNAAGAGQNSSYVQQGRNAVSGQVTVSQTGGENNSWYTSNTSTDNDANITQTGVGNNSDVQQDFQGGGALAVVSQHNSGGADNDVFIDQISAGFAANPAEFALGAEAHAIQTGSGNSSTISQTGFSATAATANDARSTQTGNNNISSISQSGIENSANLTQAGNGNGSTIGQSGNTNDATVNQLADGNTSTVLQGGNGNAATVNQLSNGNISTINQGGNGNIASVTQGS